MKKAIYLILATAAVVIFAGCERSSLKTISEFSLSNITPAVTGSITDNTIDLTVPYETDVKTLVASFTVSEDAVVTVGGHYPAEWYN